MHAFLVDLVISVELKRQFEQRRDKKTQTPSEDQPEEATPSAETPAANVKSATPHPTAAGAGANDELVLDITYGLAK